MDQFFADYTPTANTYVTIMGLDGVDYVDELWDDLVSNNPGTFQTIDSTPESGSKPTITIHVPTGGQVPNEMQIKEGTGGTYKDYGLNPYSGPRPTRPTT